MFFTSFAFALPTASRTASGLDSTPNTFPAFFAAIMPIVPGAAITTAVRDTMQGDYVAGGAKALEAFVSAAAIAAGVSFGMILTGVM